jgi:hypothetical protein
MSETLHDVLTRGIDSGLRDVGATLTGCTPSLLTGHVIRELRAAGLHPVDARREVEDLRRRLSHVVTELLRGGTTDTHRRRSAFVVLAAGYSVCAHGWPVPLLECPTCDARLEELR